MWQWLRRLGRAGPPQALPDVLWRETLHDYAFLAALNAPEQDRLRLLSTAFLARKEFHGAHGLVVTDAMALAIAAQACLPLLHWGTGTQALDWYDDFVGIVVHPDEVVAPREVMDEDGVVHHYQEVLAGEAMAGGPVMLSWRDVAATSTESGYNVVIHEFVHKLDLRDGFADGCPPLPAGFLGLEPRQARIHWHDALHQAYENFREQVIKAERFGAPAPWLDAYGASAPDEFFAVASEAYFLNRQQLGRELPTLLPLLDAFYRPAA